MRALAIEILTVDPRIFRLVTVGQIPNLSGLENPRHSLIKLSGVLEGHALLVGAGGAQRWLLIGMRVDRSLRIKKRFIVDHQYWFALRCWALLFGSCLRSSVAELLQAYVLVRILVQYFARSHIYFVYVPRRYLLNELLFRFSRWLQEGTSCFQ